ncbi:protein-disulfide reductase DsbD domain-containing protein [Niastella vici]|nr:protein-disulfide reductase DsbD domain-containing protein [Niastella vici]
MNPFQVKEKDIVSVSVNETILTPEEKSVAIIRVKVKADYHIQANNVTNESLIPISLETTPNRFFLLNKPIFPPYKFFRLEGTEERLNVFDSIFIIQLPVKAMSTTKEGQYLIKARIRYQACNAKTCLFPRTINFELPVIVKKHKLAD